MRPDLMMSADLVNLLPGDIVYDDDNKQHIVEYVAKTYIHLMSYIVAQGHTCGKVYSNISFEDCMQKYSINQREKTAICTKV